MTNAPTKTTIKRSFKGHLGCLSPDQEKAFATFKANLEKAGLYTPVTETTKASHDDATLIRFLRARRFDPVKGQKQFADRLAWEKKMDLNNLFANFPADEFENSRRYYPRWTGRRDRHGLPLYVYKLSALTDNIQQEIHAVPSKRRYERIVVLYEVMTRFVAPLCSYLPHEIEPTPISAVTAIIDLANVSLRQLLALRSHLQEASQLANANYPETLGTVIVVNAPGFFSTIWTWIKAWFDEATRDKIHILGDLSDPESANSKEITSLIAPENIPRAYGGELEWEFFDEPTLDEEARKVLGDELPKGPWIFEDGEVKRPNEYTGDEHVFTPSASARQSLEQGAGVQPVLNGVVNGDLNVNGGVNGNGDVKVNGSTVSVKLVDPNSPSNVPPVSS